MRMTLEAKLKYLEDEIKALKGAYRVPSSLVDFYQSTSEALTASDSELTVKFTPAYKAERKNLINFTAVATWTGEDFSPMPCLVMPEDEDGNFTVKIQDLSDGMTVTVTAVGSSPGTFTLVE